MMEEKLNPEIKNTRRVKERLKGKDRKKLKEIKLRN